MRCPKCHYLSFDPEPRCKNCGYDLEVNDAELALRTAERHDEPIPDLTLHPRHAPDEPPVTLELVHAGARRPSRTRAHATASASAVVDPDIYIDPALDDDVRVIDVNDDVADADADADADLDADVEVPLEMPVAMLVPIDDEVVPEVDDVVPEPRLSLVEDRQPPPAEAPRTPFRAPHTTTELPLFVKGLADREGLGDEDELPSRFGAVATVAAAPRPPLAVRRAAPEPVRPRPKPTDRRLGPLDHDLLEDLKRVEREEAVQARAEMRQATVAADAADNEDRVDPILRAGAAAIDIVVLGGIATFVFWATLRLCNISLSDLGLTSLVPLLLFLALLDVGYLLLFTAAGGQTVGKMWMGLRVVGARVASDDPLPVGQAALRAAMTMVSVVGLGLGWLPALFGRGLTLHDRVTQTRVVRA